MRIPNNESRNGGDARFTSGAPRPPRWAQTLLRWWGDPTTQEEVEGDLLELYAYWVQTVGERRARWHYGLSALKLLRPLACRKRSTVYSTPFPLGPDMIRNYFKIAFRNLVKNKTYSLINIGGLAVGMAVAMLIGLWVYDELSFDKSFANYDRIAQVMQHQTFNGTTSSSEVVPIPMRAALRNEYGTNFSHIALSSWATEHILAAGPNKFMKLGSFVDPDLPEMLSLNMVSGTRSALNDPTTILLSASVAKALFGEKDPINKLVRFDNKQTVKVAGVYEDFAKNTTFNENSFLLPWQFWINTQAWVKRSEENWSNNSFKLFVQLAPNADLSRVSDQIKRIKATHDKDLAKFDPRVFLYPMSRWHLYSEWENGVPVRGRIQFVWLFGIIGVFVLLLACINFMNLSTARSEKRAKEVGIRKAVGSMRSQLISQFFSESLLVVFIALVVSLGLVQLMLPWFNAIADKKMVILWADPLFWALTFGFSLLTGLLAGSYPAFYLSSFQPIKVLKGMASSTRVGFGRLAATPRRVLVVVQFAVSVTLIIGTVVVFRQIQHAKSRPTGYDRNGLLGIAMNTPELYGHYEAIRNELRQTGAVLDMAESSSPTTDVWANDASFDWKGKDPDLLGDFGTVAVTHDFANTVGWQFKQGRNFSRDFSTDSLSVVVNESAVKFMGLKQPLGEILKWNGKKYTIVGVIKDMVMSSPFEPVKQTVFLLDYQWANIVIVKLNPQLSMSEALERIEPIFRKYNPGSPFDYKFASDEYDRKFRAEERIGQLASVFAILAIFISCLGLFGLASYMAEQRTKEIGVRKVLGASVFNLWQLLSKDFIVLVVIAVLIASPTAYYVMNSWLQQYAYRSDLSWWIFALSGMGALAVTMLTVSYQSIKAALMNPVKSLRSE
ncbi:ABC transporter permease [Spirosoma oryzicola]|uniref:ABC transporter permease n=1 Tax=Spirosoma oryzicola TaxID=2898794 RepID=UPI001E3AD1A3|nr:ABC transporter permease [Spirosoma oryzicola]UHG92161.1 ABC transporter permease [Spirosoma oryzicola]